MLAGLEHLHRAVFALQRSLGPTHEETLEVCIHKHMPLTCVLPIFGTWFRNGCVAAALLPMTLLIKCTRQVRELRVDSMVAVRWFAHAERELGTPGP